MNRLYLFALLVLLLGESLKELHECIPYACARTKIRHGEAGAAAFKGTISATMRTQ